MKFRGTAREDKTLPARLKQSENLRDMAVWAIQGFIKWIDDDRRIPPPQCHRDLIGDWRRKSDSVVDFYEEHALDAIAKQDNSNWTQASTAYRQYKHWCEAVNRKPVNQTNFGERLGKLYEKKKLSAGNYYAIKTLKMLDFAKGKS